MEAACRRRSNGGSPDLNNPSVPPAVGGILRIPLYIVLGLLLTGFAAVAHQQARALRETRAVLATLQPGPIEIGFAQSMSLHHQQAVGMARLMLDGRPTALGSLARSIAEAQLLELGEMRGWLRLWQQPWVPATRRMDWMLLGAGPPDAALKQYLLDCERSPTGMSGLAADADIARLRTLEGSARDDWFLALMLAHHEGGLPMARFTARESSLDPMRQLAERIVLEQTQEIALMQRMQQALAMAQASVLEPATETASETRP